MVGDGDDRGGCRLHEPCACLQSRSGRAEGGSMRRICEGKRNFLAKGWGVARAALLFIAASCSPPAQAQNYPTGSIRVIVPFAPGGSADLAIRSVGAKISEKLRQPLVIESRPG